MSLHDTDGFILSTHTATESLPDPALVNGRTHLLKNTGLAMAVWSSVGATPFFQSGAAVATVSVPRGQALLVQSDGVHWVAKSSASRPLFAATGVSNGAGDVTFNFPAGLFAAAPVVDVAVQFPASNNPIDYRITALTNTSCTVNVRQSPTLIVLSLSVLGVSAPLAGVTVHAIATPAGSSP